MVKDRKWLKEASQSLKRNLILSTDSAGSDERGDVRDHGGSPKALSNKGQGPMGASVTGKPGGMSPFQDRGEGNVWDKHPVSWVRLGTLCLTDLVLYSPDEYSCKTRGRKYGLWVQG